MATDPTSLSTVGPRNPAQRGNRFERRVSILSGAGMFLDGYDVTVIAVALPGLEKAWGITGITSGIVAASVIVGMFFGMLFGGRLADIFGRRRMYMIDLSGFVIFAIATACTQGVWQLIAFRLLLGLCIGADYPISSSITAEFTRPKSRGKLIILMSLFWQSGAFFAYILGIGLMSIGPSGWRWMLAVGAVLAAVVLLMRTKIPESPRWLRQKGRIAEAQAIEKELSVDHGAQLGIAAEVGGSGHGHWRELFSRQMIRTTIFCSSFWFAFSTAYYGVQMYTPSILKPLAGGSSTLSYLGSAVVALLGVTGAALGMVFTERIGRRKQILAGFIGMVVTLSLLGIISTQSLLVITVLLALAILLANFGPGVLNNVYPNEMFPTRLRPSGAGFAGAMSRIGAILGVVVFPVMVDSWGFSKATFLFAGTAVFGLVMSIWLAPETKGKSLEELEVLAEQRNRRR